MATTSQETRARLIGWSVTRVRKQQAHVYEIFHEDGTHWKYEITTNEKMPEHHRDYVRVC